MKNGAQTLELRGLHPRKGAAATRILREAVPQPAAIGKGGDESGEWPLQYISAWLRIPLEWAYVATFRDNRGKLSKVAAKHKLRSEREIFMS